MKQNISKVCCYCKKVYGHMEAEWKPTMAPVSHGICPKCYPSVLEGVSQYFERRSESPV